MYKNRGVFGKIIKEARLARKLQQGQLAKKLGWTEEYVARLENKSHTLRPTEEDIETLAKFFELDATELRYSISRLNQEEIEALEVFIELNSSYMERFFDLMKSDPTFIQGYLNEEQFVYKNILFTDC